MVKIILLRWFDQNAIELWMPNSDSDFQNDNTQIRLILISQTDDLRANFCFHSALAWFWTETFSKSFQTRSFSLVNSNFEFKANEAGRLKEIRI